MQFFPSLGVYYLDLPDVARYTPQKFNFCIFLFPVSFCYSTNFSPICKYGTAIAL
jgi:hypothetical protein